ncbi:hypothetical protein BH11ARM2_BH11ARM2_33090 [soil metagenome]
MIDREGLQAEIDLTIFGTEGRSQNVVAVIDTGFTEYLTLPPIMIERLGLPYQSRLPILIAGEREEVVNMYAAFVEFDGKPSRSMFLRRRGPRSSVWRSYRAHS